MLFRTRILFLLVVSGVCRAQTVKSDALPQDTILVMQRGACEMRCAVYNIVVFADGSAIFDARHYVRRPGLFKTTIPREDLKRLLDQASGLGFFDLKEPLVRENKACEAARSDAPTAILSISSNGKSNTLVHDRACGSALSKRLIDFENSIDKVLNTAKWIK